MLFTDFFHSLSLTIKLPAKTLASRAEKHSNKNTIFRSRYDSHILNMVFFTYILSLPNLRFRLHCLSCPHSLLHQNIQILALAFFLERIKTFSSSDVLTHLFQYSSHRHFIVTESDISERITKNPAGPCGYPFDFRGTHASFLTGLYPAKRQFHRRTIIAQIPDIILIQFSRLLACTYNAKRNFLHSPFNSLTRKELE